MGIISGSEATDAAKATRIVDELNKISVAMMMYYGDNYTSADANDLDANQLLAGAKAYIKTKDAALILSDDSKVQVGQYAVAIEAGSNGAPSTWWVGTKVDTANTKVGAILQNRANRLGLTSEKNTTAYAGGDTVFMKVR